MIASSQIDAITLAVMNQWLIVLAAILAMLQAQPQRPSASIEGVVVKLGSGEPIGNANIQLNLQIAGEPALLLPVSEELRRTARSDENGRFIFENVAAGEYRLIATYEGEFVPMEYGQRSPAGQGIPFEIAAGQRLTGIHLAMSPTGAISGRVYDGDGEPLGKAQVFALRPVYKNGLRAMTIVQSVESDDRGDYRLFWLAPGSYYVGVNPQVGELSLSMSVSRLTPPARFGTYQQGTHPTIQTRRLETGEIVEEMHLPVYYPNSVDMRSAAPVSVAGGTTAGGVNIATGAGLVRPLHIRGRVVDAAGQPAAAVNLTVLPRTSDPYFIVPHAQSAADGTFDIPGVIPGAYRIFASAYSASRTLDGIANVDVADTDIQNLPIRMTSGFTVPGRFVMEGRGSLPSISVTRDTDTMDMPDGFISRNMHQANADGSFTIERLPVGDFRINLLRLDPQNYVKSMRMGSDDVLNDGLHISGAPNTLLEIVIGGNAGRIEGSVLNSRNEALANRTVVLVPDARLRRRSDLYKAASTDIAGRFKMQGITPGDYKLFAWDNVETGAWQNRDFIQGYENAGRPIRIDEGSNESIQLQVIP
jgi:hypothetical protein